MFDRESLEVLALESICSCKYYNVADNIQIFSNERLLDIIETKGRCLICR